LIECCELHLDHFTMPNGESLPYYIHQDATRHIVLARDNSPAGKKINKNSYDLLHLWLQTIATQQKPVVNLLQNVLQYSNANLGNYFTNALQVQVLDRKGDVFRPDNIDSIDCFPEQITIDWEATKKIEKDRALTIEVERVVYRKFIYNEAGNVISIAPIIDHGFRYELLETPTSYIVRASLPGMMDLEKPQEPYLMLDPLEDNQTLNIGGKLVLPQIENAILTKETNPLQTGNFAATIVFPKHVKFPGTILIKSGILTISVNKKVKKSWK